jgi:hypothetical protein
VKKSSVHQIVDVKNNVTMISIVGLRDWVEHVPNAMPTTNVRNVTAVSNHAVSSIMVSLPTNLSVPLDAVEMSALQILGTTHVMATPIQRSVQYSKMAMRTVIRTVKLKLVKKRSFD